MSEPQRPTGAYIHLSFMHELMAEDDEGWQHLPLSIESWPPGIDLLGILRLVVASLEAEEATNDA